MGGRGASSGLSRVRGDNEVVILPHGQAQLEPEEDEDNPELTRYNYQSILRCQICGEHSLGPVCANCMGRIESNLKKRQYHGENAEFEKKRDWWEIQSSGFPIEFLSVYSKEGKEKMIKPGRRKMVKLTNEDLPVMKGSILTHNHPVSGGAHSWADLRAAIMVGAREMRAVGYQGQFSIKPPRGIADFSQLQVPISTVKDRYFGIARREYITRLNRMKKGETEQEVFKDFAHITWSKFATENPDIIQYNAMRWE